VKIRFGTLVRWFRKRRVLLRENRELREITLSQRLTLASNQREITQLLAAVDRYSIALHFFGLYLEAKEGGPNVRQK
jgi:hypothetical protein